MIRMFAGIPVNRQANENKLVQRFTVEMLILYALLAASAIGARGEDRNPVNTYPIAYTKQTQSL